MFKLLSVYIIISLFLSFASAQDINKNLAVHMANLKPFGEQQVTSASITISKTRLIKLLMKMVA